MNISYKKPFFFLSLMAAMILNFAVSTGWAQNTDLNTDLIVPTPEELFLRGMFPAPGKHNILYRTVLPPENHQGHHVELIERRPVADLAQTIFSKYAKPDTKLVANFFYRNKFYIARVPNNGVKNVYFQISYFPPYKLGDYRAAHSLMRFEMNEESPIELIQEMPNEQELERLGTLGASEAAAQLPEENEQKIIKIKNAAITAEAQWMIEDTSKAYNLKRGLQDAFVQVVRFTSIEDRLRNVFRWGNPVDQIKFESLSQQERSDLLLRGLEKSQEDGLSKIYNTRYYNCTTLLFDVIERVLGDRDQRVFTWMPRSWGRFWPTLSIGKLTRSDYNGAKVDPVHKDPSLRQDLINAAKFVAQEPGVEKNWETMIEPNQRFLNEVFTDLGIRGDSLERGGYMEKSFGKYKSLVQKCEAAAAPKN